MTDSRIGTTLDERYQIVEELAAGGMGVVYRGERIGLGRSVAIKFLHAHMATDSAFLKRFEIEAQAMAKLQHANCAAVIDYGVDGQEPYVVMDLVAGESLRRVLEDGRLPPPRALGIMRQVLSGLAHAHAHGITHRDIKPDNIMVDAADAFGDQVRILDFGLAKLRESATGLTTGFVVGTPSYMAPEQTLAQAVDERTDIYAAGVVLFEMLTGSKPFQADEAPEVMRMHREAPLPRMSSLAPEPGLSEELEAAVAQALAKDPELRFSSAAAFATALDSTPEAAARASTPSIVMPQRPITGVHTPAPLATAPTQLAPSEPKAPLASAQRPETEHLGTANIEIVSSQVAQAPPAQQVEPATPAPAQQAATPAQQAATPAQQAATPPVQQSATAPLAQQPVAMPGPARRRWIGIGVAVAAVGLLAVVALLPGSEPDAAAQDPGEAATSASQEEIAGEEPSAAQQEHAGAGDTLPGVAEARDMIARDRKVQARKLLERLRIQHKDHAELHYLLGQLYFDSLWVQDGIDAYRSAIALAPAYRDDPALIESAVRGLANDKAHGAVARFLVREIGQPARAALESMAAEYHRKEVRERAARVLRRLR